MRSMEIEKSLANDKAILELVTMLKKYGMNDDANDIFETASYVDMIERKLDDVTNELVEVRKQLQELQDKTIGDTIKKSILDMVERAENRIADMKATLTEVKDNMKAKATEIVQAVRWKGREALNKVSEFVGIRDKLKSMREKLKDGIIDTDKTIAKIDAFGAGMRNAGQTVVNTFRTFADKEVVDYEDKEKKFSKTEMFKKPWKWQKKVYESMDRHLEAAIGNVTKLSMDVQMHEMEKMWDEMYEKNSKELMEVAQVAEIMSYGDKEIKKEGKSR